jgi:hypothetical protein
VAGYSCLLSTISSLNYNPKNNRKLFHFFS